MISNAKFAVLDRHQQILRTHVKSATECHASCSAVPFVPRVKWCYAQIVHQATTGPAREHETIMTASRASLPSPTRTRPTK
eukprot:10905201-Karenia_brevis.AAC.1